MYVSIGVVAEYLGVSTSTLRRWDQQKVFTSTYRTHGNHRRYLFKHVVQFLHRIRYKTSNFKLKRSIPKPQAILYARVSGSKQRHDLTRQISHLQDFTASKGWTIQKIYKDIGSGINEKRKGLNRLLKDLPVLQPDYVVCSYPDRLARFGTGLITTFCNLYSTEIVYTKQHEHLVSNEEKITQDFIAILTSFAGKLHRQRRGRYTNK